MSPQGTVLPSTDETRSYLIGWWCFLSSCRKESFSALRTAERSSTGMFTSPKARAPFQMDAIVPPSQGTPRAIHHLCTFVLTARDGLGPVQGRQAVSSVSGVGGLFA